MVVCVIHPQSSQTTSLTMLQNGTIAVKDELQSYDGKIVKMGVLPGYLVLSFIISCIGSWTTLELINRRTSSKGWFNWHVVCFLLVAGF